MNGCSHVWPKLDLSLPESYYKMTKIALLKNGYLIQQNNHILLFFCKKFYLPFTFVTTLYMVPNKNYHGPHYPQNGKN